MASVNKWIGIGNLTKDVELKYMPSGDAVANITVACNEAWKDKDGNKQEHVEFVRVSFFGRQAEVCGQYLKKGAMVYIEGSIRTRKWQDQSGQDRYSTEIRGDRMQMLGGNSGSRAASEESAPTSNGQRTNNPSQDGAFDDDIPF